MRLTTKGRFAVTAMIDLALREEEGPVNLAGIAERQHISLSYLEQLFAKLRRKNIVASVRGPGGGYRLATAADSIDVAQIILAVDEPLDVTQCGGKMNCRDDGQCLAHDLWTALTDHMVDYLCSVSLGSLVRNERRRITEEASSVVRDMRKVAVIDRSESLLLKHG